MKHLATGLANVAALAVIASAAMGFVIGVGLILRVAVWLFALGWELGPA